MIPSDRRDLFPPTQTFWNRGEEPAQPSKPASPPFKADSILPAETAKLPSCCIHEPFVERFKSNIPLIEEIAQKPCPITLEFLIEQGLDVNLTNRFKQTLLHLAAHGGQVANIKLLVEKGAHLNAQDLSKKTPLYLAVVQGHLSAVTSLLGWGADPMLTALEGDTILHVAAFYGSIALLKILLQYPLLHCADEDGKQPIHKAVWGDPKPDVVQLLLEHGADPNALSTFGYTPLHWAAKHGHVASAEILLKAGALPDLANLNHDLPFDLAVRWGQDAFVRFFLGSKPKEPEQLPKDIEGYYGKQLLQAKRDENYQEQIFYLEKLSDLYVQKKQRAQAAKILNGAFAILEASGDNPPFKQYLLARLEHIEALFLESKGFKVPYQHRGTVLKYRDWLKNIRDLYFKEFEEKKPIAEIIPALTASYKELLGALIEEAQELLGPAPVKWACVGMGSMARNEMCPYSDLEFAFLIDKKTEENLDYFRTLAEFVELKVINLGETVFPIFGTLFKEKLPEASPTPAGFSMDSGGNTPLGMSGFYELIDTPKGLSRFQSMKWMQDGIITTNALSSICYISGNISLVRAYNNSKEAQLNITDGWTRFTGTPFRQKLAMKLLEGKAGNVEEFKPNLSNGKEKDNFFGIKKELYRPLQSVIGALTLYCGLPLCSSFEMIQQLLKKGIFSSEGAKNLTQALSAVLNLRFEAHTFYQNEGEVLMHIEQGQPQDPQYLYLDEKRLASLHEIYKVLIPFHSCAKQFLRTKNPQSFSQSSFYDKSPQIQGDAFEKNLQYGKAQEAYQWGVSLNPSDLNAQLQLGSLEIKVAKYKEALERNLKALALARQKHGENHCDVAISYNNIGGVYYHLGELTRALEFYHKALKIELQVLGENHPDLATSYNNIGCVYQELRDLTQALEFFNKALNLRLLVPGENHRDVAISYNSIGCCYYHLGELTQALEFHQKALKILLQVFGENHPAVATSYNNIGNVYRCLEDLTQALEFYDKALKILLDAHGGNHPAVATSYNNVGGICENLGELEQALDFYRDALEILLDAFGENHPDVAASYNNIGSAYENLKELPQALECYRKALKIRLKVLGENHPDVAISCSNIGYVHEDLGELTQGLEFYKKALKILLQVFGENHSDVAASYNNIASVYYSLKKKDKALECYHKALNILLQVLGENHSDVAASYNNIGSVYRSLGDLTQAIEFYDKALRTFLQAESKSSPNIEAVLDSLIACASQAPPSQVKALQEIASLCTKFLGHQHPQTQQLIQLIAGKTRET